MSTLSRCPRCGSTQIVKSGKRYNQKGMSQRYGCKTCGTTFCNEGYFRGKHQLSLLQYASALYMKGLSYEKIQKQIFKNLHIKISRTTIGEWIKKLGIQPRNQSCGNQRSKIIRELIEIGIITTARYASSNVPKKFIVLDNLVLNPFISKNQMVSKKMSMNEKQEVFVGRGKCSVCDRKAIGKAFVKGNAKPYCRFHLESKKKLGISIKLFSDTDVVFDEGE